MSTCLTCCKRLEPINTFIVSYKHAIVLFYINSKAKNLMKNGPFIWEVYVDILPSLKFTTNI